MEYEKFLKIGLNLKKIYDRNSKLKKIGIELIDYDEVYFEIIDSLFKAIFNKEQYDWFAWFCWENSFGEGGLEAYDKDKKPIAYSWLSLYELIESYKDDEQRTY